MQISLQYYLRYSNYTMPILYHQNGEKFTKNKEFVIKINN